MTGTFRPVNSPRRALPARPSLEHLRKEAKERLVALRLRASGSRLTEAQHALAHEYGFAHWPALKAEVERRSALPAARPDLTAAACRSLAFNLGHYRTAGQNGVTLLDSTEMEGRFFQLLLLGLLLLQLASAAPVGNLFMSLIRVLGPWPIG